MNSSNYYSQYLYSQYLEQEQKAKQQNIESLQSVIERGIQLLGDHYLNENLFKTWQKYSIEMLNIICSKKPSLIANYYTFMVSIQYNMSARDKLQQSIQFLITLIPSM